MDQFAEILTICLAHHKESAEADLVEKTAAIAEQRRQIKGV